MVDTKGSGSRPVSGRSVGVKQLFNTSIGRQLDYSYKEKSSSTFIPPLSSHSPPLSPPLIRIRTHARLSSS